MSAFDKLFDARLRDKVERALEGETGALMSGAPADYAAYREIVGKCQAYRNVIELCGEIRAEIFGGSKE